MVHKASGRPIWDVWPPDFECPLLNISTSNNLRSHPNVARIPLTSYIFFKCPNDPYYDPSHTNSVPTLIDPFGSNYVYPHIPTWCRFAQLIPGPNLLKLLLKRIILANTNLSTFLTSWHVGIKRPHDAHHRETFTSLHPSIYSVIHYASCCLMTRRIYISRRLSHRLSGPL